MPKTRRFIDKKHAVTFKLIHRSQHDPLVADERAPKRVLVPENYAGDSTTKKLRQEQEKFGIFFDDDYDYLQHLKETGEGVVLEPVERIHVKKTDSDKKLDDKSGRTLMLPSSVFPSEFEEKVGLLNRAAPISGPRPDLDPDIIAALDDDFDFNDPENELDDNFVAVANAVGDGPSITGSDMAYGTSPNAKTWSLDDEETRSRFTNYSLTSSVMRRNSELTLLDDRFEEVFAEYDDDEIGALDGEEIDGSVNIGSQLMDSAFNELREGRIRKKIEPAASDELHEMNEDSDSSSSDEEVVVEEQTEKWDCESILSTYSNLYNHPKVITEPIKPRPIKVSAKTGIPVNVLKAEGLTEAQLAWHDSSIENNTSPMKQVLSRPRHETAEERKLRKNAVKDQRRDRRMEKKANTMAFKEEKKRQEKIMINLQTNLQGVTIR